MPSFIGKLVGGGLLGLVVIAIFWTISALFWGWILMLVLGAFHVTRDGHTLGYGFCFPLGYVLALVLG